MKIFIFAALLLSLPLYAQDDAESLETGDETMESNPLDVPEAEPTVEPEVPEEKADDAEEEKTEKAEENVEASAGPTAPIESAVPVSQESAAAPVTAEQTVSAQVHSDEDFNPRESHWYTTFAFEAMEYNLPFDYTGSKNNFQDEYRQLYGGRIGFGGELYLGAGFATSTRVEGYYMGTLFEKAKTAGPEVSGEKVQSIQDTGQIFGADVVQTLSFMFEMKTVNPLIGEMTYLMVEPFVEAGVGRAQAYNQKEYSYDSGVIVEEYDQAFIDDLTNVKIGGGINFTSKQGYFLTLKVTENRYDITKRKTKGYYYANGNPSTTIDDPEPKKQLDSILVYTLGGGYKF